MRLLFVSLILFCQSCSSQFNLERLERLAYDGLQSIQQNRCIKNQAQCFEQKQFEDYQGVRNSGF
jgi:hypothetical protein